MFCEKGWVGPLPLGIMKMKAEPAAVESIIQEEEISLIA